MDDLSIMSEADASALKDTLFTQQQLLQKLYNELDAEREASATAASEALSVILRLQGEKAAVNMEAEQYKRLSEEKIGHAEESFAIIEDIIYQKEMEIAALNHQVQAYRYRLLSMGCADNENLLQRAESLGGDHIGRRNSAPISFKYKKSINERDSGKSPEVDLVHDLSSDSDHKKIDMSSGGISSYWDLIRKLDIRVKEIAGVNRSPSSASSQIHETRSPSPVDSHKVQVMNVHDVFEVPQVDKNLSSCKMLMRMESKRAFHGSRSLKRDDVVHPEAAKLYDKDEHDWMKNVLESKRSDNAAIHSSNLADVQPSTSISYTQPLLNQCNRTAEIIEEYTNREEELKLLNEIKQQLTSLQDEITSWKVKKSSKRDEHEPSLCALSEAMLYFWL